MKIASTLRRVANPSTSINDLGLFQWRLTLLLVCLAASVYGRGSLQANASETRPPNIVFIITDDMMPWMFNFLPEGQGKVLSPNIDRLAAEGTVMLGQHVVSPVCTPSRYSCLTGQYASRAQNQSFLNTTKQNGQTVVQWNSYILPSQEGTLPKRLQQAGYTTGIVGKNHVIEAEGIQLAKWEDDPKDPSVLALLKKNAEIAKNAMLTAGFDYAESIYYNNPDYNGVKELAVHNMDWITDGGLRFIDENAHQPFFLYFATTVPHGPLANPRSWNADPLITPEGYLDQPLNVLPARDTIPKRLADVGLSANQNVGNVLWLDDAVGAIMDRLKKHGIEDNTIVVFFNDHGQMAKGTIYQGGIHNPSIIWRKDGFACGSTNHALISNIDFAPTLLEWAGVETDADSFDGKSFAPILDGQTDKIHDSLYFEMGYARGVRKGDMKYIALRYPSFAVNMTLEERTRRLETNNRNLRRRDRPIITEDPTAPFSHIQLIPGGGDAEAGSRNKYPDYFDADQLYNLASDPEEQTNLANDPKHELLLLDMQAELKKHLETLPGKFAELHP